MISVSVVIITLNEEKNIGKCLNSVSWLNEIIIVDSGSVDRTKEICNSFNCKIIDTPWLGFGKTKQFAVSQASNDWILSIDSDEEITKQLQSELMELLKTEPEFKGYRVKRNSFYLGRMIKHCGWDKDYTLRLFNRKYGNFNDKEVHEYVKLDGPIGKLKSTMMHYTYPDLSSHINKMKRYSELGATQLFNKGKQSSLFNAVIRGASKFLKMYILQMGFLDGKHGFLLSINSAWGVYLKYLLLWEMKKSKSSI